MAQQGATGRAQQGGGSGKGGIFGALCVALLPGGKGEPAGTLGEPGSGKGEPGSGKGEPGSGKGEPPASPAAAGGRGGGGSSGSPGSPGSLGGKRESSRRSPGSVKRDGSASTSHAGPAEDASVEDAFNDNDDLGSEGGDVRPGAEADSDGEETSAGDSERAKALRSRTLAKYHEVLLAASKSPGATGDKLSALFSERQERRLDLLNDLSGGSLVNVAGVGSEAQGHAVRARRARAHKLKKHFFENSESSELVAIRALAAHREEVERAKQQLVGHGTKDLKEGEDEDVDFGDDSALETVLREVAATQPPAPGAKAAVEQDVKAITGASQQLIAEQARMLVEAKKNARRLVPLLKKQAKAVSQALQTKLKEGGQPKKGFWSFLSRAPAAPAAAPAALTPEQRKAQDRFQAQVARLRREQALLEQQLSRLRLETQFPRAMQWKLRVDVGDGTFLGVRDLEVGKVVADFELVARGGEIELTATGVEAQVGVLELAVRGASTTAKVLGGVLSPTATRMDLDVKGSWRLVLCFGRGGRARWEEVRERSNFNLEIARKVTGLSAARLPPSVLATFSKLFVPSVLSAALRGGLPAQLGELLKGGAEAVVRGRVELRGDMSPAAWRSPLVAASPAAAAAREALGVTEDEAVLLDLLLRGPRAQAAGFHKKAASLARLYKWRLRFAALPLAVLEERLLEPAQRDARVALPKGWLGQILRQVCALAKKPLDVSLRVRSVRARLDVIEVAQAGMALHLAAFRQGLGRARGANARALGTRLLDEAERRVLQLNRVLHDVLVPGVADRTTLTLSGVLVGGAQTGLVALVLEQLDARVALPRSFELGALLPSQSRPNQVLEISGRAGPGAGEYTLQLTDRARRVAEGRNDDQDPDAEMVLSAVRLDLFPADAQPGAVLLGARKMRAALQFSSLDALIKHVGQAPESNHGGQAPEQASGGVLDQSFVFADSERLVRESERALENFSSAPETAGAGPQDPNTLSVLPKVLALELYELRAEVKRLNFQLRKEHDDLLLLDLATEGGPEQTQDVAFFFTRLNMRDVFDELLY